MARKQVERNRSNPAIFIVTYTAEHNHPAPTHRNSLAGSTRQKPSTLPLADAAPAGEASASTAMVPSPTTSFEEEEVVPPQSTSREEGEHGDSSMEDEEVDVALSSMAVLNYDDFYVGLLNGEGDQDSNGDCFLERFPANFGFSWNPSSTAAAATGR